MVAQCDALIEALKKRKLELIENVHQEREMKVRVLKEQVTHCTSLLQKTTGLLHFCIEVLKEGDPASFLQVSSDSFIFLLLFAMMVTIEDFTGIILSLYSAALQWLH